MKLTFEEAKDRFAGNSQCDHDPDFFYDVNIPNSQTFTQCCGVCQKQIQKWYGMKSLEHRLIEYLSVSKTRKQIYFRFKEYSPNTIRGRLSDLKRKKKIFSIEQDVFTPVEKEKVIA